MKIIITESQLKLIKEAVGVPEGIMDAAEELYEVISNHLKTIEDREDEYKFVTDDINLTISDFNLERMNLTVGTQVYDGYDGDPVIASMGVGNSFRFDDSILMQVNFQDNELNIMVNYAVSEDWEPEELYNTFTNDENHVISVMAHELKHRFDRSKKRTSLVGNSAQYQAFSSGRLDFGIPVISDFMRYSYYIQLTENLVRPTEVATRMIKKGITKEKFYDFIMNDEAMVELKKIQNFSYDYLIEQLYEQMDRIDALISYAGGNPNEMGDQEKVVKILELVYINIANLKVDIFDEYIDNNNDSFESAISRLFGGSITSKRNEEKDNVRRKFVNFVSKYQNREIDFFKDECERFNYEATKLMKKISKIYSLIPDEKEQTNESILNWDLHQKLMEKRYGKRPIETSYKYKK